MDYSLSPVVLALPEIALLIFLCVILCVDVCLSDAKRCITYVMTQVALLTVMGIVFWQYQTYTQILMLFDGHYRLDKLAMMSKLFMYLFSFFSFAYAYRYIKERNIPRGDYYLLGLCAVLGMSIMASGNTLLTIFLGLELLSLPLYAMVAMHKESKAGSEAAMKYFILGSLASGFLLYGMSLLYGVTGSLQLHVIHASLLMQPDALAIVALIFIVAGLVFKFGAVPFHMWVPDLYQGAPTSVTLFIASAPKIAAFVVTVRLLGEAMPSLASTWTPILIGISILSMSIGNVLAIAQSSVKRMLAYSSIAHIGYTLLGVLIGPTVASGYSAAMFYIVTYALVAAGAFAIIALMSQHGVELDHLHDYRGLNTRHPWLAFMMLLLLFSMAGVPPTVGFFAKLGLLEALIQGGYAWLAILALGFALIGAYYYLRLVMYMYFEEPTTDTMSKKIELSPDLWAAITVNGMAALVLGLMPSYLIELCRVSLFTGLL